MVDEPKSRLRKFREMEWRRLFHYVQPYRGRLALGLLCLMLSSAVGLLMPLSIGWLVKTVTDRADTALLDTVALALLSVFILQMVFNYIQGYLITYVGERAVADLRIEVYAHLQKLSLAFYSKQRTGDLLSRVTSDVSAIEEFVIKSLSDIVGSFLLIGFILFIMITGAWEVALVAALIIPLMALISNYFSQRIKAAAKKQRTREGDLASAAQEMLTSIRVIQAYGSGGNEARRFAEQSRKAMDTSLEAARQELAGDPSLYTSSLWRSSSFINPLSAYNANIFTPAGTNSNSGLAGNPGRQANAIAAGLPANFFRANPDMLGGAIVTTNGGFTRYNSMQLQFRRRLSGECRFDLAHPRQSQ